MRSSVHRYTALILGLVFLLALSACSAEPEATATPTKTPEPVQAQAELESQSTPVLVATVATSTPEAATPTLEPATPTPGVVVEGLIGPDDYDPGVNPLTGLVVQDPADLDRRPITVKISNSPAQYVRPHSGLDKADLVFEHYAEGGVTRLTAVFYGRGADQVGSVRSGRLIDLELPAMYQSAFAYSGSSVGVKDRIRNSDFFDRVISPDFGYGEPYFYRVPRGNVPFEHTLFADLYDIWAWLDNNGNNQKQNLHGMAFSEELPTSGAPAGNVQVNYIAGESQVTWAFVEATGLYMRWQGGEAHSVIDGTQLSAANVVVVGAHHEDSDILEDHVAGGHYSIEIQVWGEGPASLFRDGMRFEGRWHRTDRQDMLTFTDLEGNPLPFKPGNTWFELVPLGFDRLIVEP